MLHWAGWIEYGWQPSNMLKQHQPPLCWGISMWCHNINSTDCYDLMHWENMPWQQIDSKLQVRYGFPFTDDMHHVCCVKVNAIDSAAINASVIPLLYHLWEWIGCILILQTRLIRRACQSLHLKSTSLEACSHAGAGGRAEYRKSAML